MLMVVQLQAIGGAVWHGVKGFRNSPYGERRIGAITAIKARAPVLGGNFGVWGGLFSTFDCAVKGVRKKEDPYNASMSDRCCYRIRRRITAGGCMLIMIRYSHSRILHRGRAGSTRRHEGGPELSNSLCLFAGGHRRCWNWVPEDDGRKHSIRCGYCRDKHCAQPADTLLLLRSNSLHHLRHLWKARRHLYLHNDLLGCHFLNLDYDITLHSKVLIIKAHNYLFPVPP